MRTFRIPADCEITLGKEPASLADLRQVRHARPHLARRAKPAQASSIYVLSRRIDQQRAALLIGVEKYDDPALTRLSFPVANVELLRQKLVDRYAFNPDRIEILDQSRPHAASRRRGEISAARQGRGMQVIVYFCGHVYRIPGDHYVLAARHFEWDRRAETGVADRLARPGDGKLPVTKQTAAAWTSAIRDSAPI